MNNEKWIMKNVLKDKSYNFALELILLSTNIQNKNEFVLGRQLMISGTAIGALIREAEILSIKWVLH